MFRWLIFEIKQMMFNRKNLIIFAVLLISHLLIVSVFENDDGIRSKQLSMPGFGYELVDDELNKAIAENNVEKYNEIKLIRQLKEVNRVERYLLNMEVPTESSLKAKVDSYYNNFDLHQQLKQEIYEKYGFIDDNIDVEVSVSVYNSRVSHLQYNLEVLNKGFMLYDAPSRSSLTITVTLYRIYLVFIVLLAPLIVGFDNISKDKKDGSIKTIMALSQSRSRYYVVKLFSTLIVSMMMIFLPFIIAMLVNNVSIIK